MSTATITAKQVFEDYMQELCSKPKTPELIDKWVDDPNLKQHILQFESGFPNYQMTVQHIVSEGDIVAVHATATAVHKGTFAGIEPTGKPISVEAMMFYRVSNGRIKEFWMQADMMGLIAQLKN